MALDTRGLRESNLALLSPLPTECTLGNLRVAYGPALVEILRHLTRSSRLHLDIAVPYERHKPLGAEPRGAIYEHLQLALGSFYSLLCHVSSQYPDLAPTEKTTYCVFLVSNEPDDQSDLLPLFQGPILNLRSFASAQRKWSNVYALDGEEGESVLRRFSTIRKCLPHSQQASVFDVHRVKGGTKLRLASEAPSFSANAAAKRHFSVAVGGTFDHLHAGHKLLLTATAMVLEPWQESAAEQERFLIVGITGDELLKNKKYAEILESWEQRQKAVIEFLSALLDLSTPLDRFEGQRFAGTGPNANAVHYKFDGNLTVKCVEIQDPFGPTITDENISALVVSGETRSGGKAVNDKRKEKGWASLEVFEISVLDESPTEEAGVTGTEEFQSKISSTAIRKRLHEQMAPR